MEESGRGWTREEEERKRGKEKGDEREGLEKILHSTQYCCFIVTMSPNQLCLLDFVSECQQFRNIYVTLH